MSIYENVWVAMTKERACFCQIALEYLTPRKKHKMTAGR